MNPQNDIEKQDTTEDSLSFLNSLPEVKKKPKPDVFAEHLAFLDSLEIVTEKKPDPVVVKPKIKQRASKSSPKKAPSQVPKKKSNVQLQREEKNRLEQERAVAKKTERLARQKEATASAAVAEEKQAPEPTPVNKSLMEKALSFIKPKPVTK